MNNPPVEDLVEQNGLSKESPPSSSADTNANLNMDESKGAIPKTKSTKSSKKPQKTNNNIDDLELKRNGYDKNGGNYLNNFVDSDDELSGKVDLPLDTKTLLNIPPEDDYLDGVFGDQLSDSSSDDNELLSMSDDGCIYTYKGDQVADLPSSFFNLDLPPIESIFFTDGSREENSSPEMDFLEMDFDPGPSGDADSDSASTVTVDDENPTNLPLDVPSKSQSEPIPVEAVETAEPVDRGPNSPKPCCSRYLNDEEVPTTSSNNSDKRIKYLVNYAESESVKKPLVIKEIKMPWSCSLSERTKCSKNLRVVKRQHTTKSELVSPSENGDYSACNLNLDGKILIDDKNSIGEDVEKVMIWTEQEACLKQITQIGPSLCGATAVLNVLNALRLPIPTAEKIQECVATRIRANSSPLPEYLLSRSRAGCSHRDIIKGLHKVSQGRIYARFFAMYPERVVNLQSWLGYWIKHGAIPIATVNLQKCEGTVPDSWHHQMIFGVGPKGLYLTNPLECVEAGQLFAQLSSESVLLVKTEDVISRWSPKYDLPRLMRISDVRWRELNVVGQVAKIVREQRREVKSCSHLKIPADYRAGITLALDINSAAFSMLCQCPELPLLQSDDETASAFHDLSALF